MAPEFIVTVPTVPSPDNVAAEAIVTALLASLPFTCKLPTLRVVAPLYEFMPLKIWVPVPTFLKAPRPAMLPEKVVTNAGGERAAA